MARPDTGSDGEIMTEAFAKQHGHVIHHGGDDKAIFKTSSGKLIQSIGRTLVSLSLIGERQSIELRWFHVLKKCAVPIVLGDNFIKKIKLLTENKHPLEDCTLGFGDIATFKWIGSPQQRINFVADGKSLTAGADTGSDLDLMSLQCG
jgi:hypothetical protein